MMKHGDSRKNPIFRGRLTKNQYRFKVLLGKKKKGGGGGFLKGELIL